MRTWNLSICTVWGRSQPTKFPLTFSAYWPHRGHVINYGKHTDQSESVTITGQASLTDGIVSPDYGLFCIPETGGWVVVDLHTLHFIDEIVIDTNQTGECQILPVGHITLGPDVFQSIGGTNYLCNRTIITAWHCRTWFDLLQTPQEIQIIAIPQ